MLSGCSWRRYCYAEQAQVKPLVKHVLSKEQQLYYEQVVGAIKGSDELLKQVGSGAHAHAQMSNNQCVR